MVTIPEHYIELERIYSATLARDIKSLAVVSTFPGEGVSSIIIALAKRNALAGRKTLLVDLNIHNPALSSLANSTQPPDSLKTLSSPTFIEQENSSSEIAVVTGPVERKLVLSLREPGVLESHIEAWLKDYDSVLVDTSPMSLNNGSNLPPEYIASACGGTVVTVLAGQTTNTALTNTIDKLSTAKALLIGIVINDQFNPTLKDELLREIHRLDRFFPKVAAKLRTWVNNRNILALEV